MKKAQKISLVLALCSLSIFAVGCQEKKGNTEKKEANTTNNTNTSEKKETKVALSNELLQKVTDASKAVKSANANTKFSYKFKTSAKEVNNAFDSNYSMVKEPAFTVKITNQANIDGKKIVDMQYLTDNTTYAQNASTKAGIKQLIKKLEMFLIEKEKL